MSHESRALLSGESICDGRGIISQAHSTRASNASGVDSEVKSTPAAVSNSCLFSVLTEVAAITNFLSVLSPDA